MVKRDEFELHLDTHVAVQTGEPEPEEVTGLLIGIAQASFEGRASELLVIQTVDGTMRAIPCPKVISITAG